MKTLAVIFLSAISLIGFAQQTQTPSGTQPAVPAAPAVPGVQPAIPATPAIPGNANAAANVEARKSNAVLNARFGLSASNQVQTSDQSSADLSADPNQAAISNQTGAGNFPATNLFAFSNQLPNTDAFAFTNRFETTNQFSFTNLNNRTNLSPTGRTNTGRFGTNSTRVLDRATSEADRRLLVGIRQRIETEITLQRLASNVGFLVQNGVVTLLGAVPTVQEAQGLAGFVQQLPGVQRVENQTQVAPDQLVPVPVTAPAANPNTTVNVPLNASEPTGVPTTEGVILSEGTIVTEADRALFAQIRPVIQREVGASDKPPSVQVSIKNGVVILTGTAADARQRRQIVSAVQNLSGVALVKNQIQLGTTR
jgi:hypothetical protein